MRFAETERQAEVWKSFLVEELEGFRYALIGSCWHGKPVARLWGNIRNAVNYSSNPGHLKLIVIGVSICLPRLSLEIEV